MTERGTKPAVASSAWRFMDPNAPSPSPADRLLGLLLALPALAFALPAVLQDVPTTDSAGAGFALLAALPAALVLALRGARRPGLVEGLLAFLIGATLLQRGTLSDAFEARRALVVLATSLALFAAGRRLGAGGRRMLVGLSALGALVHLGLAAYGRARGGALGNPGDLVELVVPGALCGAVLLVHARGLRSVVGGLALLGLALLGALGPVWAAGLALAGATVACVFGGAAGHAGRRAIRPLLLATLVALAAPFALQRAQQPSPEASPETPATATAARPPSATGGLEFRVETWRALPDMLAQSPWLGVGAGQFEASFPPFRRAEELALSTLGGLEPTPVDVEHPHNDWWLGPIEYGLPLGLAWVLVLLGLLARSFRRLSADEPAQVGAALGVLGLLLVAGVNSPLLNPVAAHVVFWPLAGCLFAGEEHERSTPFGHGAGLLALVLLGALTPWGLQLWRHGRALAELADAPKIETEAGTLLDPEAARAVAAAALQAAPDSVVAMEQLARNPLVPEPERLDLYASLLEARPYRRGSLMNRAALEARVGSTEAAGQLFDRLHHLDPRFPGLWKNRLLLAVESGVNGEAVLAELLELEPALEGQQQLLRQAGLEALRRGRLGLAETLLLQVDGELSVTDPNVCYSRAQEAREAQDTALEEALLSGAHASFGREHLGRGDARTAARSLRQALRFSGRAELALELAAALADSGELEEARAVLERAGDVARVVPLPGVRRRLAGAGLLPIVAEQPE